MGKICRTPNSKKFIETSQQSRSIGEANDWAVIALSILTGRSYLDCHQALQQRGRRTRTGTNMLAIIQAAGILGFEMKKLPWTMERDIISSYPERDRVLQNLTTHHPIRFQKIWKNLPNMMLETSGHVAAFMDGELHDWSSNKALRVIGLWQLTPTQK